MNMRSTPLTRFPLLIFVSLVVLSCSSTTEDLTEALADRMQLESGRLTATGYADIGVQSGNPSQQRILAIRASKIDAYRSLSEQIYGLYIDASTTVGDLVAQNDVIQSRVEGIIYGAEIESVKPISDSAYEVRLSLSQAIANDIKRLYLQSIEDRKSVV